MNKLVTPAIVLLGMCLICSITLCLAASRQEPPPVAVETQIIQTSLLQKTKSYLGTLVAQHGVILKSESSGLVTSLPVKNGQNVRRGQIILQTNPAVIRGQLDAAKSQVKLTKLNKNRSVELFRKKAISSADYDASQNAYETALANKNSLQAQLDQTFIEAPFSGKIGLFHVQRGDFVSAGTAVVNLQDSRSLFVDFSVPQTDIEAIKKHTAIHIINQTSGQKVLAKWLASDSLVDASTRKLSIRAKVSNLNQLFLPGEFVVVEVAVGKPEHVIKVPQLAVENNVNGSFIYKLIHDKAVKTKVVLGLRKATWVIIKKGLAANDVIITAGRHKLFPNAKLTLNPH